LRLAAAPRSCHTENQTPVARDILLFSLLVVSFAILATAHLTLALGLVRRPPRWRAIVALVVPPLAPLWGWREKMRVRSAVWVAGALVYAIARVVARE
jgi:hypothetical protein